MKRLILMATVMATTLTVSAQYPDLTSEAKNYIENQKKQWQAHSDSAWKVAFPVVIEEAKAGRPYVPWASRPYDLRQAHLWWSRGQGADGYHAG